MSELPELRLSLSEYEFEILKRAKGNRTWKQFLLSIAERMLEENKLIEEINRHFEELKKEIVATTLDSDFVGLLERMRVIVINASRINDAEKRKTVILAVCQVLDEAIKTLRKLLKE